MPKFKIALLCGGPSLERAISLNSARTVLDHLHSDNIEILPVYFDYKKNAYLISKAQLYSNTPADFDFKLSRTAKPLTPKELIFFLKKVDLTFPVMHGQFGEDGQIQKFLEKNHLPFVGSPSSACRLAFDKHISNEFIKQQGYNSLPSLLLLKKDYLKHLPDITKFFNQHNLKRAIVKPATSGSSIAVYSVSDTATALKASQEIFSKRVDSRAVLEPFCRGKEFTVIILENKNGQPVAILPTEIELSYKDHQIFDYRKKYLATRQVVYHCPPRFSDETIFKIQKQAQELFRLFGMRDFARFDGWLEPDGKIMFTDFNPISGMEQNSFLFMQSSRLGMSHSDFLKYVVKNACRRYNINFPGSQPKQKLQQRKKINVLFGGSTAERQVSVMSGTNVWLKLRRSAKYDPQPYLLDINHQVWRLPYTLTLNHTVEEITETCQQAKPDEKRLKELAAKVIAQLKPEKSELTEPWFLPEKMTLNNFIKKSPYIFIGLHGGLGENGELQKMLEKNSKPFNGSPSSASRLCIDKLATGEALTGLSKHSIFSAKKTVVNFNFLKNIMSEPTGLKKYWQTLLTKLGSPTIIVKPVDDGCSAGIARLYNYHDLKIYFEYVFNLSPIIPNNTLTNQHGIIEMPAYAKASAGKPAHSMSKIMFEEFITTDKIQAINNKLSWQKNTDWIEITAGLLEKKGKIHAFNPSLTVARGNVLTLEEKFQGGTGINVTPPPEPYVNSKVIKKAKISIEIVAKKLGIKGYGRIDAFMNIRNGEIIVIEANTLPGLTPSTVIYHQALAETPPLYPKEFLERIVGNNY